VLWLLVAVPLPFIGQAIGLGHTPQFLLSVVAIVPLAGLLSTATESVAAKLGDAKGGLLNATLGNLTELVIALTALRAGEYMLVKASIAGAIVTNTLFMLGASLLLGGLKHHVQEYNRANARLQVGMLFLSTFALLVPSSVSETQSSAVTESLSLGLAGILMLTYCLGLFFSLHTHRALFGGKSHEGSEELHLPVAVAVLVLAATTLVVALVSEIFVESVQKAAETFGMSPAFVGFIIVSLVGAAAEFAVAFPAAPKNRLDMSVSIALGSASQIALFVAPVLVLASYFVGPGPMDLRFTPFEILAVLAAAGVASLELRPGGR